MISSMLRAIINIVVKRNKCRIEERNDRQEQIVDFRFRVMRAMHVGQQRVLILLT